MRKTAQKYFNTQPNDSPAVKYEAIDESNGVTGLPKKVYCNAVYCKMDRNCTSVLPK